MDSMELVARAERAAKKADKAGFVNTRDVLLSIAKEVLDHIEQEQIDETKQRRHHYNTHA